MNFSRESQIIVPVLLAMVALMAAIGWIAGAVMS